MKYKAIGFDYGGVIIGEPNSTFFSDIANILNLEVSVVKKTYFDNNFLVNEGKINYEDFWEKMLTVLNKIDKKKDVFYFLQKKPKEEVNQDLIDLVKKIREKGYKTGLFTNNSSKVIFEIKNYGIDKIFDVVMVSSDIGYMKPNPKAFEIFTEKLCVSSRELVFVDDTEMSLSTADEVGFTPILFKDVNNLKEEFCKLGIL